MATQPRKPFKICPADRSKSLGVVAATLQELKSKACEIFNFSSCHVVLENDGTEVDDEEYFQFIKEDTRLMIIGAGGNWQCLFDENDSQEESSQDEDEVKEGLALDRTDGGEVFPRHLIARIKRDPAFFVSFQDDDLEAVVKISTKGLSSLLHRPMSMARHYKDASQQELDRRMRSREATELLKLLKTATDLEPRPAPLSKKRKTPEGEDDDDNDEG